MAMLTPSNLKSVKFELSGLDEYLAKIQAAGNNIDEACEAAIVASAQPIYDDIKTGAERHVRTGTTLAGVDLSNPIREGNKVFVEVGINENKSKGARHIVFTEYGSPTNPPDPFIRTAFTSNKAKVKKLQREILKARGVPID